MEIEVFECTTGVGKTSGKPYNIVLARVQGKVGKFFSDVAMPVGMVKVNVEMGTNREMYFTPKFVLAK